MLFLISAFTRFLTNSKIKFMHKTVRPYYHIILLCDIPEELENQLRKATYKRTTYYNGTDELGNKVLLPKVECLMACEFVDRGRIRLHLDQDTYADKINAIEVIIRHYVYEHTNR